MEALPPSSTAFPTQSVTRSHAGRFPVGTVDILLCAHSGAISPGIIEQRSLCADLHAPELLQPTPRDASTNVLPQRRNDHA